MQNYGAFFLGDSGDELGDFSSAFIIGNSPKSCRWESVTFLLNIFYYLGKSSGQESGVRASVIKRGIWLPALTGLSLIRPNTTFLAERGCGT